MIQILIIILLTTLAYLNIFQNEFATDDIGYVFNWQIPKDIKNIPLMFSYDSVPRDEQGVYRPVKALFFLINYKIWGLNVFGYHLFSILVHLINTLLVYSIVYIVCSNLKRPKIYIPFLTALLFGLHPIHTEAVTFILASFDTVGITFFFLSFYLYLESSSKFKVQSSKLLYVGSIISAFLAFFTYEMTLTLPLLIVLYDLLLGRVKNLGKRFRICLPYFLILGIYLFIRFSLLHIPPRGEYLGGSFYITFLTMAEAFVKYIKLLLLPINLSLNHEVLSGVFAVLDRDSLSLETLNSLSIFSSKILVDLGILLGIVILGIGIVGRFPLVSFGIFWFFITLLPVSFVFPQSSIMAERYIYLGSFGFCLMVAFFLSVIPDLIRNLLKEWIPAFAGMTKEETRLQSRIGKVILGSYLVLIILFYIYQTYTRNKDWKDTQIVWEKLVLQHPNDPVANQTLGKIYAEQGKSDIALQYFQIAKQLNPNIAENFYRSKTHNLYFYYPSLWQVVEEDKRIILESFDKKSSILMRFNEKGSKGVQMVVNPATEENLKILNNVVKSLKINE